MPLKITRYNMNEVREYYDIALPADFTQPDAFRGRLDVYSNDDKNRRLGVYDYKGDPAPFLYNCDSNGKLCRCGSFPDQQKNAQYAGVAMNSDETYRLNPSDNNYCNSNKPLSNKKEFRWRSATYKRDHRNLMVRAENATGAFSGQVKSYPENNVNDVSQCASCGGNEFSCGKKCP